MTTGDEPQLGGQDRDEAQGDLAPMISGRGTQIIADARGAYLAGNLDALFTALNHIQRMRVHHMMVGQVLAIIRPEIERAAEEHPVLSDLLRSLDAWLQNPTILNRDEVVSWQRYRALFQPISLNGINERLPYLIASITGRDTRMLRSAIMALYGDRWPDLPEPHRSVIATEIRDWSIEACWAALHTREAPTLRVDQAYIDALIADAAHWYHKKNLTMLVHLMTPDQRVHLTQAIRQQAMLYIQLVPAARWNDDERQIIEQARGWLADPSSLQSVDMGAMLYHYTGVGTSNPTGGVIASLIGVFRDQADMRVLTDAALNVARYVKWILKRLSLNEAGARPEISSRWQLEAAWAILHDRSIPPLEVEHDHRRRTPTRRGGA